MKITLSNIGKRYRYEWIFKAIDYVFDANRVYAVQGANGAGKSTFMQLLSGHLSPSKGSIEYHHENKKLEVSNVYRYISFAAPYLELIEEFTLLEIIDFHFNFKSMYCSKKELLDLLQFSKATQKKAVKYFSSGMQQRLKLALAVCSRTPLLLLDEPTVTLDTNAIAWYQQLMAAYAQKDARMVVIASNVVDDFMENSTFLDITKFKK